LLDKNKEGKIIPWAGKPEGINRRTNLGKTQWANFEADCKRNGVVIVDQETIEIAHDYAQLIKGKIVLDDQDLADAVACVQALNNHPEFAAIMAQPRRVEVPFEFELFGHPFKAKPDAIIDSMRLIVDIKTTDDASPHRWQWSAVDYGYHRQAYIYQQAVQLETNEWYRFIFAVVEKPKPSTRGIPPTVALYELDSDTVRMGLEDACGLVLQYEQRMKENDWQQPYSSGIVPLRLPRRRVYEGE
jgi:exodeoxyribonuclease VIII